MDISRPGRTAACRRAARLALLVLLATVGGPAGRAGAQNTTNVNDCTLLKDPTELRDCVLRFEGAKPQPPIISEGPASIGEPTSDLQPPGTPVPVEAGTTAGRPPVRASAPAPRALSPLAPAGGGANPSVRPRANDTATSIEQIEYPPRPHR